MNFTILEVYTMFELDRKSKPNSVTLYVQCTTIVCSRGSRFSQIENLRVSTFAFGNCTF